MARPCDPKSLQLGLTGALNQDPYCDYKIHFPPISQGLCSKQGKNLGPKFNSSQNPTSKSKIRFQCHYEERRRRAEFRRKKIIQKLKKNYAIDVDGLNEDIAREIIMKAEIMEKEKREREKKNVNRMVTMISRLIEEQKYKNRGTKIYVPPWRRSVKPAPVSEPEIRGPGDVGVEGESEPFLGEGESQNEDLEDNVAQKLFDTREHINEEFMGEEETLKLPLSEPPKLVPCGKVSLTRKSSISIEMCLESNPKRVVFNDYVKGKVYVQDLRITNIGLETIHCRYLGIVVHTKGEHRFPVGVAVRDNVKLRPGLCCSTKIRLCSQEDTRELRCSVVYETRRQKNPLHHSWFFVPVVCVPVRALVKVIPTKITFPSLTWCEATGPEGAKFLRKILRIENTGAKACWCRISNVFQEPEKCATPTEIKGEGGEGGEEEREGESLSTKRSERNFSPKKRFSYGEEYDGEGNSLPLENAEGYVRLLVEELFENIFSAFRFSTKYCIVVPPFSTVQIEVRFFPQYKGFHHETYFIQFEDCDNCKEQAIELVGDIKKIPLTVQPQMIDFRICIANSGVYAGTLTIFNQSKGPYSVVLKVPSSMKNHAHVYPRANTILPLGSSDFSVRFYPRVTLARDAPKYFNENSLILEFPIFIHPANTGACKRDCLKVYIFALVTDYCLELTPSCINFGVVNTLETVRTKIELTNHSLAIQEYGFLNLPKGVRVEPNLGFGKILPKESITLYLLYSPGEDVIECDGEHESHEFQVAVTSIAKYGGFREKLEPYEESTGKEPDLFWGEGYTNKLPALDGKSGSEEELQSLTPEKDFDVCEEDSSIEGEEFCTKIQEYENKIREFLSLDSQKVSERSYFKKMNSQGQGSRNPIKLSVSDSDIRLDHSEFGEFEEQGKLIGNCSFQSDIHIINCRAVVVVPRCRISETVILLPATAYSSFSLYRFRLECIKVDDDINCSCGFRKVSKCVEKQRLQSSFEFQYLCPHIKLEPESGYIKPGDSLPITIIYRPEFPAGQLQKESRKSKAESKAEQEKQVPPTRQSKGQLSTPKNRSTESTSKKAMEDVMNAPSFERENSDLLSREKSLDKPISPFHVVTKLQCVIKTTSWDNQIEKTEVHEMVLICPAIKPNFIYLGNSQEIKFNKIFVGTKSKTLVQIQNISLERTSPSATLLNPTGTFFCPSDVKKIEVDPEHTWGLPLIYAPVAVKGIEKQFFEIYCKSTNIFLTVSGEAMMPDYKITPNFSCCEIEAKLGSLEELKIEMENLSSIEMNLQIRADFEKEGPDLELPVQLDQTPESKASKTEESKLKKEKEKGPGQKEDAKEKKKTKNSGNENFQFWEDVPEVITSAIQELEDMSEEDTSAFILLGVGENNKVAIPPSGKQLIKIQFKPPPDRSGKKFAIKFAFLLEGVSPLKEIIVVGKIFRGK